MPAIAGCRRLPLCADELGDLLGCLVDAFLVIAGHEVGEFGGDAVLEAGVGDKAGVLLLRQL